jgi:two-component system cell cycle sensor histidine kinase/response regulator CckA
MDLAAEQLHALDPVAILECTQDSVYLVDGQWRLTYLNQRAQQEIGRGQNLIGQSLWQSFPDLRESAFGDSLVQAMVTRQSAEVEAFYPRPRQWFALHIHPAGDGLVVFFRNVSSRHLQDAALTASETRFRVMFETLTQGVVFHDRSGAIVEANPAALRILGLTMEDILSRSVKDARWQGADSDGRTLAPEDYPAAIALRTGRTVRGFVMSVFNPLRDELCWLRIDAIPQFAPGSAEPYQVYALFSDITEQKLAEEALRASRAHLAAAQRVASVGSAEADFRTGRWEWSDETYRIYGRDRASFTPQADRLVDLVHPEDRQKFQAGIEASKWGIDPPPLEFRILRPDGEVRTVYREVELVRDETGRVIGGIATKQDVTDLREADRRRQELERQLLHAQRIDSLGTLAGGIAHDLNNILVPVIGLTEYLQSGLAEDHPDRAVLDVIQEAGQRARDLVEQILTFSRRDNPDRQEVDLSGLIRESMRLVRASVPATIRIVEELDDVPRVFADPGQLHQILLNLTANATHAIGHGIGTITISATRALPRAPGSTVAWLRLSVADTGCGIDLATQKRIFEPFFTTKPAGQGTGLGLSVVHGIVASHGGMIEVDSEPGRGTRMHVYLPALQQQPGRPASLVAA